ncbi:hypothetical protein BC829DRAFT_382155 [Chytridium lagenaria]|nr:hypothetical protein BC829DRAFT_382155 [Chytridium lagenaria]
MLLSPVRKLLSRVCLLKLLPLLPCQLQHARAVACLRRFPVFVRLTTLMGRWRRPPLATVVSAAKVNEVRITQKKHSLPFLFSSSFVMSKYRSYHRLCMEPV